VRRVCVDSEACPALPGQQNSRPRDLPKIPAQSHEIETKADHFRVPVAVASSVAAALAPAAPVGAARAAVTPRDSKKALIAATTFVVVASRHSGETRDFASLAFER